MATAYDDILYPSGGQARLHIENLHLCALLNGYRPAPVERARVLELGCGTGFNLIPMAMELPEATFVGVDYAARPIQVGNSVIASLGVPNIRLECADIAQSGLELGEFDYIIAHGLYSWIPDAVRDAMWELVRRSLAPHGIFHVSYNALPGWYTTFAVRDFLEILGAGETDSRKRLDRVWDGLGVLARHAESGHLLAAEAARIRSVSKEVLFHDEMGSDTKPFYLTEVVDRARAAGLRYVAEADLRDASGLHKHEDVRQLLAGVSIADSATLRKIHDFMCMRRFHDTLFAHEAHAPKPASLSGMLAQTWAHSDIRLVERGEDGEQTFEHSRGLRITTSHPVLCALAAALEAAAPASISLGEFWTQLQAQHQEADPNLLRQFWPIALQLLEAGALRLRVRRVHVATVLSEYPVAMTFCRIHAQWDSYVANTYHASSTIPEPWQRAMLTLLDGSRDRAAIARDLAALCWEELQSGRASSHPESAPPYGIAESPSLAAEPARMESEEALRRYFETRTEEVLQTFLRAGYLV